MAVQSGFSKDDELGEPAYRPLAQAEGRRPARAGSKTLSLARHFPRPRLERLARRPAAQRVGAEDFRRQERGLDHLRPALPAAGGTGEVIDENRMNSSNLVNNEICHRRDQAQFRQETLSLVATRR